MKCLAVDTSGEHLTVLLIDGERVDGEYLSELNLRHSTMLMPTIEKVLNKSGVSIYDIDVFACVVGPGSFTGIRIGISTIKAFSYANNKKVLPVTSFEVLEYNKPYGKNLAVIDAKHDNFYVSAFCDNKAEIEPKFISLLELLKLKEEYNILASKGTSYYEGNCDLYLGLVNAVKAKLSTATLDREKLVPLYVRKSQAEEAL
ncbi:MAG: tRNA (adenosine(37)-N6)-threonylcarbamoyltransferase complex dimerization subunit type 1 TsaB [Clostridia bacterium]|nr:tRNA (adenosine(37)-N6)-threonylcarbamoyltransferase complex dimerization subunit type 1 TsaB [Clostridia bacterium]